MLVDSSAWLAVASADDRNHSEADRHLRAAVEARVRLLTTDLILAEVHRLLLFRAGIVAARAFLDRVRDAEDVTLRFTGAEVHTAALRWLDRLSDQRITYADAVSFAVAQAHPCRAIFTFDRHFSVAGFVLWQHVAGAG